MARPHVSPMPGDLQAGPELAVPLPQASPADPGLTARIRLRDGECFSGGSKLLVRYPYTSHLPAIALFARLHSLHRLSRNLPRPIQPYKQHRVAAYSKRISIARADLPRATVNMPTTLKEFEGVFPKLVADLKQHCEQYKLPTQALKWFEEVCHAP